MSLLMYRNTPVYGVGYSPTQMLFGRPLKDTLQSPPVDLGWDAMTCVYEKKYTCPPQENSFLYQDSWLARAIKSTGGGSGESRGAVAVKDQVLFPGAVGDQRVIHPWDDGVVGP